MSEFLIAWGITKGYESAPTGGYSNDPKDTGGESYCGISRRWNPAWPGWAKIDAAYAKPGFPKTLESDAALQELVVLFYRQYWDKLSCGTFPQILANEIFDTAVNLGPRSAIEILQQALNLLNNNGAYWPDLKVDGDYGAKSATALAAAIARGEIDILTKTYNGEVYVAYRAIVKAKPEQERFFRSWLRRVSL